MQNLVQPYLLGFKQALPSYSRVPTKEEPFDSTYFANKIIAGNCYPDSCDIISNVEQGTKLCNTYEREKTGRVRSHHTIFFVIPARQQSTKLARAFYQCRVYLDFLGFHPGFMRKYSAGMVRTLQQRWCTTLHQKNPKLVKLRCCKF